MPRMLGMDKISRIIDEAGGVGALADALGVRAPTVYQWKNGDRKVSPRLALAISKKWPELTTVHDLRPDVFGPPPQPERGVADAA